MSKFSAIVFDCDGVLINSQKIYIDVELDLLAELGLTYDMATYQTRFVGLPGNAYTAALEADYAQLNRGSFPTDFDAKASELIWARFATELRAIDGLVDFIAHAQKPMAIASSSGAKSLSKMLKLTDLHHRFDPHIYSGDMVQKGKPEPDLFLLAANGLNHAPENCLVFEDSVNGVRAGIAAGMHVWGFTGGGHADEGLVDRLHSAGAHQVFASFADMQKAFS